jgi:hypothetical protein
MFTVLLPLGDNPIAVKNYEYIMYHVQSATDKSNNNTDIALFHAHRELTLFYDTSETGEDLFLLLWNLV